MIYSAGFDTVVDQLALAVFVCAGVARLARFNIAAHLVSKSDQGKALYHEGLPTAYAALLISTEVAVAEWTGLECAAMVSKRLHLYIDGAYSIPALSMLVFAGCWSHSPMPIKTVLWRGIDVES
jgi:CDP-diacylglycerol--serine O-phosphatidyltransferase